VDGWAGNGILPLLHVRAGRSSGQGETSDDGGAPADLRPELAAFLPVVMLLLDPRSLEQNGFAPIFLLPGSIV
jgi:hypothetical protein